MMASPIVDAVAGFGLALIKPVTDLISEVVEDKDKANELAHKIATMAERQAHEVKLAQIQVNATEAAHKSLFVAGWRPACGWICTAALGFNYIAGPMIQVVTGTQVETLDLSVMLPVLLGMLGLGVTRSFEKVNGVARER